MTKKLKLQVNLHSDTRNAPNHQTGDRYIDMDLYAFGNKVGTVTFLVETDGEERELQYIIQWQDEKLKEKEEWNILKEGHKEDFIH